MAILLGVDTGGTYTDAVLLLDNDKVLASAKSLTTRHNLADGVAGAIDVVIAQSGVNPTEISMASLSTTLATNALVEGQGGRVALVFIGFDETNLKQQGLEGALSNDPLIILRGGHQHSGNEIEPLDLEKLNAELDNIADGVSGFAVVSQFATRNSSHETSARDFIRQKTGKPVTCSHELTSKLGGPKRAVTAVLNARLIGMIDHLISSTEEMLHSRGIDAPLMVVRGDGALISSKMARSRPIETILSGPAASLVGARWLTDVSDGLVSDIGGTTTDVAVLHDGKPMIDPEGARVGPYRTMVEAVATRTSGLGGDSEVHFKKSGLTGNLTLGPKRVLPISRFAMDWPELVHKSLDMWLASGRSGEFDGCFILPIRRSDISDAGLTVRETAVLNNIGNVARRYSDCIQSRPDISALERLKSRGLIEITAITPSDACHVLGLLDTWDREAAEKALILFGRQHQNSGTALCSNAKDLAQMIITQLTEQTAVSLLECAFAEDADEFGLAPEDLARHLLVRKGMDHHRGTVSIDVGLNIPIVGLGASASTYYGAVGQRLSCEVILPKHANVANALGAVVGQISMRKTGTVSTQGEGQYRAHLTNGPIDFTDYLEALEKLEHSLRQEALQAAKEAGSDEVHVSSSRDLRTFTLEGKKVFVEGEVTVIATGRPRLAK